MSGPLEVDPRARRNALWALPPTAAEAHGAPPLLEIQRLSVHFGDQTQPLGAVDGASFHVRPGETVCLVGESGSGKTVTALSILRLEGERRGQIAAGEIRFAGRGLVGLDAGELDALRGRRIAMVFQEPMSAFDPLFKVGDQIIETIRRHEPVSRREARRRAIELLERVQIPDARLRLDQIPEQLSGGMRQRAMIALALACKPDLLVADEPTTALDVTLQAQILALLKELQRKDGMSILLITHDLGVAAELADRIVVMYAGRIIEQAPAPALFASPAHPYTRGLLDSVVPLDSVRRRELRAIPGSIPRLDEMPSGCRFHPRCPRASDACKSGTPALVHSDAREVACFHPLSDSEGPASEPAASGLRTLEVEASERSAPLSYGPLIEARALEKRYALGGSGWGTAKTLRALDGVSLHIDRGETLGLVGESGSGKSTLGRVLLQLERPDAGQVLFEARPVERLRSAERKRVRQNMQMIFQDPYGSIDPRWRVRDVIAEPLVAHGGLSRAQRAQRTDELLELVGLPSALGGRYAHELSGGQRQRVGIARALALRPQFIVADEAVSALDVSVQAQVINLLARLREQLQLTTLFIGHGLHVVRHLSDRLGVMYFGRLVEIAPADELFRRPAHHYTAALLSAIPIADPRQRRPQHVPAFELPSPSAPPRGCHFHPRCPAATERCRNEAPLLEPQSLLRSVACHHPR